MSSHGLIKMYTSSTLFPLFSTVNVTWLLPLETKINTRACKIRTERKMKMLEQIYTSGDYLERNPTWHREIKWR